MNAPNIIHGSSGSNGAGAEDAFTREEYTVRLAGMSRRVLRFTSAGSASPVTLDVPAVIADRYEIDRVLTNSGGQGVIYSAHDRLLARRRCLVKALRHTRLAIDRAVHGSPEDVRAQRETLERECRFLVTMQRRGESRVPNLLRLERDLFPGLLQVTQRATRELLVEEPYMVMQYVPGATLKSLLAEVVAGRAHGGGASRRWWRASLQIIRELASILKVLHATDTIEHDGRRVARGYFYGDLKPDNCIVTGGEFVTLIDFGGVRSYWRDADADADATWRSERDTVYTPGYAAPEMIDPAFVGELDARVDVYSAGALLWSMLTGLSPARLAQGLSPILSADDPRLPGQLPGYMRELLRGALEPDPERRTESASALKQQCVSALQRISKGE